MDVEKITMAGVWVAALGLLGVLLRQIGPWRQQLSDLEAKLRQEMHDQIAELHTQLKDERADHAAELKAYEMQRDEMGDNLHRLESQLNRQQLRHNAERALDRHRLNNINQCFDALLLLLRASPEKSADAVKMIEDMRAKQLLAEAEEKAIIRAAEITMDAGEMDHDGN
jgi:septal ring factor EnvC (AmiA/AmiB activator)